MRKLFAVLLVSLTASANETSWISFQSGPGGKATPLHDRGIRGEGQIVAVLDTGVDYTSCYFAEADGSHPPFNTGSPSAGLEWQNVDLSRRKVVAYDFLYSCDQYPGAPGCDTPGMPGSTDNQGHGTHAAGAIAGDRGTPLVHEVADAIAPAAKLIVQDAGYVGGDACSQRPGIGCPTRLTPILDQAYRQGARIHSNSWGDRQGKYVNPPTANYPQSARDVDAFVWSHPDMLVVFNTGNMGSVSETPLSSLSAPGSAKNTIQVGGTRSGSRGDDVIWESTLFGPARDGRIKPDLVGPARVRAADIDFDGNPNSCDVTLQAGTSWSSPSVAGAAALVRQYFVEGFQATGTRNPAAGFLPSAALLKATLIAAARPATERRELVSGLFIPALPAPSHEQGWGFPVLDDALYFSGDARGLRVYDVPPATGLAAGESVTRRLRVAGKTPLKAVLVWTDPPGEVRSAYDTTPQLVNDLDLTLSASGSTWSGNGAADRLNNVEVISLATPPGGVVDITVTAHRLGQGSRQSYALVVVGDFAAAPRRRAARH